MTAVLTTTARVVHANRVKAYGVGQFVSPAGPGCVRVQFDADRHPRTVRLVDLANEGGVPLVLREPYRVVYSKEPI